MAFFQPIAKPYERRCTTCGALFNTGTPGALWRNPKGAPRYLHPGCQQPAKAWRPEPAQGKVTS